MLILTRRQGENIVIGDEIQIQVLSVSEATGDVRVQIDAPDLLAVQCVDVDSDMTARRDNPVITHKRRRRSILTK
ncbi:carbon storage regulator [Pseudomonas quasicaspiana]|uniref:carbon storage regulator n=1 Tax=Pseudomonas quasicaspiana TaxID=2829821 RepID=UPI001E44F930|nr:carbon storage regulator [Pseudomonas quasicaspiana]MCD5972326.1 carbon storage regulator [Pseudomonas quasicaspiana]